jgi:hypothetical protein
VFRREGSGNSSIVIGSRCEDTRRVYDRPFQEPGKLLEGLGKVDFKFIVIGELPGVDSQIEWWSSPAVACGYPSSTTSSMSFPASPTVPSAKPPTSPQPAGPPVRESGTRMLTIESWSSLGAGVAIAGDDPAGSDRPLGI